MTKIYFDLNEYQTELKKYYKMLAVRSDGKKKSILRNLYLFVLKNYEDGIIGPKKFAYDVAGLIQFEVTDTGKLKEITELALELELPDKQISGDPQTKLEQLVNLLRDIIHGK